MVETVTLGRVLMTPLIMMRPVSGVIPLPHLALSAYLSFQLALLSVKEMIAVWIMVITPPRVKTVPVGLIMKPAVAGESMASEVTSAMTMMFGLTVAMQIRMRRWIYP